MIKRIVFILIFILVIFSSQYAFAKRVPPTEISDIVYGENKICFECSANCTCTNCFEKADTSFCACIVSRNKETNAIVWRTQLYEYKYNPNVEKDVQYVFLKTMKLNYDIITATDEKDNTYKLNAKTGLLEKGIGFPSFLLCIILFIFTFSVMVYTKVKCDKYNEK